MKLASSFETTTPGGFRLDSKQLPGVETASVIWLLEHLGAHSLPGMLLLSLCCSGLVEPVNPVPPKPHG